MKTLPRLMLACMALVMLGGSLTGCAARSLAGVSDHGTKPVTIVRTSEYNNYLFYQSSSTKFWLCQEQGDTLTCKSQCEVKMFPGGDDVICPAVVYDLGGRGSSQY